MSPKTEHIPVLSRNSFLRNATHLIHDRDPLFTEAWVGTFDTFFANSDPNAVLLFLTDAGGVGLNRRIDDV